ncbi:hypothetical protein Droror1_Dr00014747 [Drosera rotundifolia]
METGLFHRQPPARGKDGNPNRRWRGGSGCGEVGRSKMKGGETRTRVPSRQIQNHNQPRRGAKPKQESVDRNSNTLHHTTNNPSIIHHTAASSQASFLRTEGRHRTPSVAASPSIATEPFHTIHLIIRSTTFKPIQPPPRSLPFPFAAIFAAGEGGAAAALVPTRHDWTRRRWTVAR